MHKRWHMMALMGFVWFKIQFTCYLNSLVFSNLCLWWFLQIIKENTALRIVFSNFFFEIHINVALTVFLTHFRQEKQDFRTLRHSCVLCSHIYWSSLARVVTYQAVTWNDDLLSIKPTGTNCRDSRTKILQSHSRKCLSIYRLQTKAILRYSNDGQPVDIGTKHPCLVL